MTPFGSTRRRELWTYSAALEVADGQEATFWGDVSVPHFGVFDTKLRPTPLGVGVVARSHLVGRMLADERSRIVVVAAPAGYGKTTVLTQWSSQQPLPVAWLTVDHADNDPLVLLAGIAAGVARVVRPALAEVTPLQGRSVAAALTRLLAAVSEIGPMLLVLDQVEALTNAESTGVVAELAARLPAGSRLALATRAQPPLPVALLRSRGDVLEVGQHDLAMSPEEGRELLEMSGATFGGSIDDILEHTEGWPVALYFAGCAARAWSKRDTEFRFGGDDRLMGEYLHAEVLSGLDEDTVTFLARTSILDRLSGPLCDAVLETSGSQRTLELLAASNALLIALDEQRGWYRLHHLLRELLAADLRHHQPELVAQLHSRAAAWFAAHRSPELALHHAQAAGDAEQAAMFIAAAGAAAYAQGRLADVSRWIEWFPATSERDPEVAVLGALVDASRGHPAKAERWAALAEAGRGRQSAAQGEAAGWKSFLDAFRCSDGVTRMRADARRAQRELSPRSPLLPGALLLEGLSFVLEAEHSRADSILARAHELASGIDAMPVAAAALAERALIAIARDDWTDADMLAARAVAIVDEHDLGDCLEAAIVFAAAARTAVHAGDLITARDRAASAARLRPLLTYAAPWTAHYQLELARVHLELADAAGVRAVLREVADTLRQRPDLGNVASEAERLGSVVDAIREHALGVTSLTVAELRLLPYLSTHRSFPEIGGDLNVSRHTVKTQAISIYRKLGVASRSEAIRRAREVGLLQVLPSTL